MTRFISKEKLGKKARRELDRRQRRIWPLCPVTRTAESKKLYNRKRKSHDFHDEWTRGIFGLRTAVSTISVSRET